MLTSEKKKLSSNNITNVYELKSKQDVTYWNLFLMTWLR